MNKKGTQWLVGVAALLGGTPLWAAMNADNNFGLDVKITAQSEDDRDLGTRRGGDLNGLGLDLRPWLYGQSGNWSGYVMGQAVTATDTIETDTLQSDSIEADSESGNNAREPDKSYLALREFWVDYAGLTAYPGEHLRFGRQRVRTDDSTWWDTNIEAVQWVFDTTLLRAQVGAAERFSEYRTDIDDLDPDDEDKLHLFGALSTQWQPGHWVGVRAEHARDDGNLAGVGETVDELSKTTKGDLTWIGLNADGDFYNWRTTAPFNYWAQAIWMTGDVDTATQSIVGGQQVVTGRSNGDVDGWAVDLGLRWNVNDWRFGGGYARASGGTDSDGDSDQFVQTGLQSNRSSYTGTRSRVHRFGEAFRGELSNLQAFTLFGAWQLRDEYDASLVYHRFWRVDDQAPSGDDGLSAALEDGEKDLGQEVDLVLTRYFKQGLLPAGLAETLAFADEPSALVRLRGGLFFAGDAYGNDADSTMHRVFVDVIWRF